MIRNHATRLPIGLSAALGLASCALLAACPGPERDPERTQLLRIGDDLVGAGGNVSVTADVPGDVMIAGGDLAFTGNAGGDVLLAGGNQSVGGTVAGSLRAAGGDIRVLGAVGRNATLAGGNIRLEQGSTVEGNAYFAGGDLLASGTVTGSLRLTGGTTIVDGRVGGDVDVRGGRLRVGPNARVQGNLTHRVDPDNVTVDPGAQVAGEIIALPPPRTAAIVRFLRILAFVGFLVAGGVAIALFPRTTGAAAANIATRPFAALGFGLAWIIGIPIVLALIAVTVVGIPLAIIAAMLYAISLYLGRAILALWLGRRILGDRLGPHRPGLVLGFIAGALILGAISLLPILGFLVTTVATILGLGGTAMVLSAASRGRPATAAEEQGRVTGLLKRLGVTAAAKGRITTDRKEA